MQTGAISYRVADFLKQHPPFQTMDEEDLIALASHGRVKFNEADEFILWQGTPLPEWLFVIQQGTVSLWETTEHGEKLCDIRGAGDIVGIDRFHGHNINQHSVKAASDVVLYALPADEFAAALDKYPQAAHYVAAHASVTAGFQPSDLRREPHQLFVHDAAVRRSPTVCGTEDTVREAARRMARDGTSGVAVLKARGQLAGVFSTADLVRATSQEDFAATQPVSRWMQRHPPVLGPSATVSDCVLAIAETDSDVAVLTERGAHGVYPQRLISFFDLAPAFGDHPVAILREIGHAPSVEALQTLQQRARAFAGERLTGPGPLDWLAAYLVRADVAILRRLIELNPPPDDHYCWALYGAAGRGESLPPAQQRAIVILPSAADRPRFLTWYRGIQDSLPHCGYLARDAHFDDAFSCAGLEEWTARFEAWIADPIAHPIHHARPLFDLRAVLGDVSLWQRLYEKVRQKLQPSRDFVKLLAHDCLSALPPLTFYQDVVIDESGVESDMFHLKRSALRPLVDVGRVFGIAAGRALGGSTLERFRLASTMLPEQDRIFREASDMLRVVLYLQARTSIRLNTMGIDIDPAMLSQHDRQILKSGFRSIHQLLEFTAEGQWMEAA